MAVAEAPAKAYNPLFIYGDSGLGKTHLLHAIGHYAQTLYSGLKVRYVSSEEFTNDFINLGMHTVCGQHCGRHSGNRGTMSGELDPRRPGLTTRTQPPDQIRNSNLESKFHVKLRTEGKMKSFASSRINSEERIGQAFSDSPRATTWNPAVCHGCPVPPPLRWLQ